MSPFYRVHRPTTSYSTLIETVHLFKYHFRDIVSHSSRAADSNLLHLHSAPRSNFVEIFGIRLLCCLVVLFSRFSRTLTCGRQTHGHSTDHASNRLLVPSIMVCCHYFHAANKYALWTVYRRRPGLPSRRTHHLEQHAGQRDISPVSVNFPSAFKNISVPGLVPGHCR